MLQQTAIVSRTTHNVHKRIVSKRVTPKFVNSNTLILSAEPRSEEF